MEDWKAAWQPVADAIGTDLGGHGAPAADPVEASTVRRYLEPLEFDCALHYDRDVAQAHGYPDITVPYTGVATFTIPPMWRPGRETLFPDADPNAQPARSAVRPVSPDFFPPYTSYFATDIEIDFVRPVHVGERIARRGSKLVACDPKETSVGRGAFLKYETDVVTQNGEMVARMRNGMYYYTPHEKAE